MKGNYCPVCEGARRVLGECPLCNGRGTKDIFSDKKCSKCGGSGKCKVKCEGCNGTGDYKGEMQRRVEKAAERRERGWPELPRPVEVWHPSSPPVLKPRRSIPWSPIIAAALLLVAGCYAWIKTRTNSNAPPGYRRGSVGSLSFVVPDSWECREETHPFLLKWTSRSRDELIVVGSGKGKRGGVSEAKRLDAFLRKTNDYRCDVLKPVKIARGPGFMWEYVQNSPSGLRHRLWIFWQGEKYYYELTLESSESMWMEYEPIRKTVLDSAYGMDFSVPLRK